jgi:hypothetical protein
LSGAAFNGAAVAPAMPAKPIAAVARTVNIAFRILAAPVFVSLHAIVRGARQPYHTRTRMKDALPLCRSAHDDAKTLDDLRGSAAVLRFARLSSRFDAIASTTGRCAETSTHTAKDDRLTRRAFPGSAGNVEGLCGNNFVIS